MAPIALKPVYLDMIEARITGCKEEPLTTAAFPLGKCLILIYLFISFSTGIGSKVGILGHRPTL
nr:hypothetical protein Q903MT_gene275 [Picea sitchensis]